jgi:hypothetical protein
MDQMTLFKVPSFTARLREALRGNKVVNVPVAELVARAAFGDRGAGQTVNDLRTYKIEDSTSTFIESIKREGVVTPIEVSVPATHRRVHVYNGHHRLFVAEQLGIETVPVQIDPYDGFEWDEEPRRDLPWSWHDWEQRERLPLTPLHFG